MVKEITTQEFRSAVLNGSKPAVVDFWASWCGPCKMLSPIVDSVSEQVEGIDFYKVNVDEEPELAMQYGIMSIPCLILFRDGAELDRSVGVVPEAAVKAFAEKAL